MKLFALCLISIAFCNGQNVDKLRNSARFRWLSGQSRSRTAPTVIRVADLDLTPRTTEDPLTLFRTQRPSDPLDTFVQPKVIEKKPNKALINQKPATRAPPPPPPPAFEFPKIPPALADILGIRNLGLPGLIDEPSVPVRQSVLSSGSIINSQPVPFGAGPPAPSDFSSLVSPDVIQGGLSQLTSLAQGFSPQTGGSANIFSSAENFQSGLAAAGLNPQLTNPGGLLGGSTSAGADSGGLLGVLGNLATQIAPGGVGSLLAEGGDGAAGGLQSVLQQIGLGAPAAAAPSNPFNAVAAANPFANAFQPSGAAPAFPPASTSGLTGGGVPSFGPTISGSSLGGSAPPFVGVPRLPSLKILPNGIPRTRDGNIDTLTLMAMIAKRVSNGSTLADVLPASQIQKMADNLTSVLLPSTPDVHLEKMMGRWFEGINSPRSSPERCVVHHYGGLTENDKTATFTALKIYREGSEFGQVKYSVGYAFRSGHKNGMLQMHASDQAESSPFWVYKLGPEVSDALGNQQYAYAIISNWVKYPVTVLVRDPDSFNTLYREEVLSFLKEQGFLNGFIQAFNMMQPVSYEMCQYSESTFRAFG